MHEDLSQLGADQSAAISCPDGAFPYHKDLAAWQFHYTNETLRHLSRESSRFPLCFAQPWNQKQLVL